MAENKYPLTTDRLQTWLNVRIRRMQRNLAADRSNNSGALRQSLGKNNDKSITQKGGFIIGGSGGTGVLFVKDEETGTWSQPAFYTIGSLSVGLQIGAEKAEILMAVKTQKGIESFYKTTFRMGGDVSLAAGPGGAGAKTNITADIVSFAKTKGAFAGVSLEGAVVKTNYDANKNYYGQSVQPVDILVKGEVSNPGSEKLREALRKASAQEKKKVEEKGTKTEKEE